MAAWAFLSENGLEIISQVYDIRCVESSLCSLVVLVLDRLACREEEKAF